MAAVAFCAFSLRNIEIIKVIFAWRVKYAVLQPLGPYSIRAGELQRFHSPCLEAYARILALRRIVAFQQLLHFFFELCF